MIYKEHYIELFVNGKNIGLENQKSLNMRFNNVLFDPAKISTSQAEYSFEFEIPATRNNNTVFDYANNLSKVNKFHNRYNAEVYADGTVLFNGTLTLNSYKDGVYKANLVSVKNYSLDEIFGDSVMTDINNWKIPFNGVETINNLNSALDTDVTFPLVSYGVFAKDPYNSDEVANDYTSKFDIDEYNRWYVESFYPSPNVLDTLRHAFEYKGYIVGGDAFENKYLNNIYMSTNLSDGQSPDYNVGNPRFGQVDLNATITTTGAGYEQELDFPYFQVYAVGATSEGFTSQTEYNYSTIDIYDVLNEGTVTMVNPSMPSYMYQPNENVIVVPADGFYKIEMTVNSTLGTSGNITAKQWLVDMGSREMSENDVTMPVGFGEITPLEIHLVRNYDDNIELIKGKNNRKYANGNPNDSTYELNGRYYNNITDWVTCFPHEDPYSSQLPTEQNDLSTRNRTSNLGGLRTSSTSYGASDGSGNDITSASGNFSGYRGGTRGGSGRNPFNPERKYSPLSLGYVYNDNEIHCYDQAVSEAFICGFSTMSGGVVSMMKNGYSWSPITSVKNQVFAPVVGYSFEKREAGTGNIVYEQTQHNSNTYINTPISRITTTNNTMNGYLSFMVYLNKNDILSLKAIHRGYETAIGNEVTYQTTSNIHLKMTAFSNRSYDIIKAERTNRYEAPVEFDENLNIANFFNSEKKISEWVQNVVDAFNLEVLQNGNTVSINTKRKMTSGILTAVDIDDRVNSADAESSNIDYPKSMAVKYKIDTDEWGFERSAVLNGGGSESVLDRDDWKTLGDSGYTVISLNDDSYVTNTSDKNLQFSYTWYDNFNWYNVTSADTKVSDDPVTLKLPVISKYSYMIDGYSYEESMKHDGFGLSQRFWFRPEETTCSVWTDTYPPESVRIYKPSNLYTNYRDIYLNLSYKNTESSLLTEFFNFSAYLSSNYVEVEVYLNPEEYNRIKNGALIHFDSDLYYPVEIQGYDSTGYNPTTLKMMKKVI